MGTQKNREVKRGLTIARRGNSIIRQDKRFFLPHLSLLKLNLGITVLTF
jgi:hypothetical protein